MKIQPVTFAETHPESGYKQLHFDLDYCKFALNMDMLGFPEPWRFWKSTLKTTPIQAYDCYSDARGNGRFIWKYNPILAALERVEWDDVVFYSDVGHIFTGDWRHFIEMVMEKQDHIHFTYTSPISEFIPEQFFIDYIAPELGTYDECKNFFNTMAGFHIIKKTKSNVEFYKKMLDTMLDTPKMVMYIDPKMPWLTSDERLFSIMMGKSDLPMAANIDPQWNRLRDNTRINIKMYLNRSWYCDNTIEVIQKMQDCTKVLLGDESYQHATNLLSY